MKFPLRHLYLYLTQGCNQACRHCWLSPKYDTTGTKYPTLSLELIKRVLEQAFPLGLTAVKLTGGEPTLNPEFLKIVSYLFESPLNKVSMETNGLLLDTPGFIDVVKHIEVSVSLDGVNAETHDWVRGCPGSFDRVLSNLRKLQEVDCHPQLIMTLMKRNVGQIEALIDLAISLGANSVKFNVLHPMGRGQNVHEQEQTLSLDEIRSIGSKVEEEFSQKYKMDLMFDYPLSFSHPRRLRKRRDCTCGIKGILGVIPQGHYALCGVGEFIPELVFGSIENDPLSEVWENHPILKGLRAGLPKQLEGVCSICTLGEHCLGTCIAQNYFKSGHIWAPFYLCQEAFDSGTFPKYYVKRK